MRLVKIMLVIAAAMLVAAPLVAQAHFNPPILSPTHVWIPVEGAVSAIVSSGDGSLVAAGTDEGLLYLVNASSGKVLWATALQGGVTAIKASIDLSRIIVATDANELVVFDRNGGVVAEWERCTRFGVKDLFETPEGYIVVMDRGGWLYAYNPANVEGRGEQLPTTYRYISPSGTLVVNITRVTYSSLLLTSDGPGNELGVLVTARVLDNTTGNAIVYNVPGIMVYDVGDRSLAFKGLYLLQDLRELPAAKLRYYMVGSQRAAVVSVLNVTHVYNLPSPGSAPAFVSSQWSYEYGGDVSRIEVSPGGDRIFIYAQDGNAYCFDRVYSLLYSYRWSIGLGSGGVALALSGDLDIMSAGSSEGWVYVFDVDNGKRLWRAWLYEENVTSLALSDTGWLLAAGYPGELHLVRDADRAMNLLETYVYDYSTGGMLPNTTVMLEGEDLKLNASTPAVFLLPSGTYSMYFDNLETGIYNTSISLKSDTILAVSSDKLTQPIYKLIVKVGDNETLTPIEGAVVSAYNTLTGKIYNASTDPTGTTILVLPRGPYIVNVTHPLYYPSTINLGWLKSDTALNVMLGPRRAEILVHVESPVEGPLRRATVKLYGPEPKTLYTDENGDAAAYLRLGSYTVSIYAPHHASYSTSVKLYSDTSLRAVLDPLNYSLTLKVLDAEYLTEIPLFHVLITGTMNTHIDTYLTPSNNTLSLPYGTYTVYIEARGFSPASYELFLDSDRTLRMELKPIRVSLELSVTSMLTGPLQGANITLTGPENISVTTDVNGYARAYVRTGIYNLRVHAPHHIDYTARIALISDTYLSILLKPRNYTLSLVIKDAETGKQLKSVPVTIQGPLSNPIVKIVANITPSNNTLSLPYGTYSLEIHPTYYNARILTVNMASNTTLEIYLTPIRLDITVYVESKSVGAVRNARVVLIGPETLENTTGRDGTARFRPRMGDYTIRVEAAYHNVYTSKVFIGETKMIKVVLEPVKYTLRIVARDAETKDAIPLVTATIEGPTGTKRFNITPGTLLSLPYGYYKISLEAPGYNPASLSLEPLYYSRIVEVFMKPIRLPLNIRVTDPVYGAIEDASIVITGPENITLNTDKFGRASAELRIGGYTIRVSAPHRKEYIAALNLTEPTELDVKLEIMNYSLSIVAMDYRTFTPIEYWTVNIEGPGGIKLKANMSLGNNTLRLPYGSYTMYVHAPHYVYAKLTLTLEKNKQLNITLRPEEYLVRINVSSGLIGPLPDTLVQVYWNGKPIREARTRADGVSVFKLPYGNYTIKLSHIHFFPNETRVLVDKPVLLNVTLTPRFYNVTLKVVDSETNATIPKGSFELVSPALNITLRGNITQGTGSIAVIYGNYTLVVKAPDHVGYKDEITVSRNITLTIRLRPIYYAVTINVVDDRGKPIQGALVEIQGPKPISGTTDSTGTFLVNLKKGSYPVLIKAPGYRSAQSSIVVTGPVTETVKLRPTPATLLHRYLLLIIALVILPAILLIGALVYRHRKERLLEEEMEELMEEI